jgi:hypothetical protein
MTFFISSALGLELREPRLAQLKLKNTTKVVPEKYRK